MLCILLEESYNMANFLQKAFHFINKHFFCQDHILKREAFILQMEKTI